MYADLLAVVGSLIGGELAMVVWTRATGKMGLIGYIGCLILKVLGTNCIFHNVKCMCFICSDLNRVSKPPTPPTTPKPP